MKKKPEKQANSMIQERIEDIITNNKLTTQNKIKTILAEYVRRDSLPSVEEITNLIATYHYELGKRIVNDRGRNEKVSPSRELATAIHKRLTEGR